MTVSVWTITSLIDYLNNITTNSVSTSHSLIRITLILVQFLHETLIRIKVSMTQTLSLYAERKNTKETNLGHLYFYIFL